MDYLYLHDFQFETDVSKQKSSNNLGVAHWDIVDMMVTIQEQLFYSWS